MQEKALREKLQRAVFGGTDTKLYTPAHLFNVKDKLLGIQNQHYADVKLSKSSELASEARKDCTEFAVVAFWDL